MRQWVIKVDSELGRGRARILKMERNIHRERERKLQRGGVHSSDFPLLFSFFFFTFIILSPAASSSHLFAARKQIKTMETLLVGVE